jgi:hypothetical protein
MNGLRQVNVRALLQGAALSALLGGLMLAALLARPGAASDEAGETRRSAPSTIHTTIVAGSQAVHLVILVDEGLVPAGDLAHTLDVGASWVASVEMVAATDTMLRGLQEAQVTAGSPCHTSPCVGLVILDLRTLHAAN